MNLNKIFKNNIVKLWTKFDYIYSLEIRWVLKWFKKIAKLEPFTFNNLNNLKTTFKDLWLNYIYFKKNEYFDSEKMLFFKWSDNKNIFIDIYISKSKKTLEILENILLNEKDILKKNYLIWKLLWYPDCCIKSFLKSNYTWDINFNLKIKKNTIWNFDWRLNNLINPYSLIPFFPCSYNCKYAIEYAENNLDIIWNRDKIKKVFKNIIKYNDFWNYEILAGNKIIINNDKNIFNFKD